jgi:hypothetical protein
MGIATSITAALCYDFRQLSLFRGNPVKVFTRALLPAMIGIALSGHVLAQDECVELKGTPPGMYTTTDEGRTYMSKDGQVVELEAGEAGFADESGVRCIQKPPKFLDWPCSTDAAQSRMFNTYSITDLSDDNPMQEIVDRYFKVPEVIAPVPNWIDGEYHAIFNVKDIIQFASPDFWYYPDANRPIMSKKRPRSLLISLFVGTNQVVVDHHMLEALQEELGTDDLPVTFVFNDSNTVPVSYFGTNVSLEEVLKAFKERGIKVADVPMWWLGDYAMQPTIEEFEKFFDVPPLEDISAEKQAKLRADLEEHGFSRKPIIVNMMSETGTMALDQPARVRVAASMGMTSIPTTMFFIEPDMVLARCGPGTPVGTSGVSGSTTPIGGANVPVNSPVAPPPPEPEASNS